MTSRGRTEPDDERPSAALGRGFPHSTRFGLSVCSEAADHVAKPHASFNISLWSSGLGQRLENSLDDFFDASE